MTRNARMTGTCYEDGCRRRGDACGAETEQGGGREGEADGQARRGKILFLFFFLGCDSWACGLFEKDILISSIGLG